MTRAVRTAMPRIDPTEPELRDMILTETRITAGSVHRLELADVVIDGCDIAGMVGDGGHAQRLRLAGSRLRAVTWARALFDDVALADVTGTDVSLRFSTLRRVEFCKVSLPALDLTEATLDRVRFRDCDLRGARFDHAKIIDLRIEGCDLSGSSGLEALRGASIHPDDVSLMAQSLAAALGITVSAAATS